MASPLLVTSEVFRKKILVKNLTPYNKSPRKITPPVDYPTNISDLAVKDSPDDLIDTPIFAKELYTKNQYGAEGGYKQVPDPNGLLNTKSNKGEYGPGQQDAHIVDQSEIAAQKGFAGISPAWKPLNAYSNGTTLIDSAEAFSSLDIVYPNGGRTPNAQPYPTTFNPSSYSPVSILLSPDPQGSNGLLSADSYIARLGATVLRKEFETRIGNEIRQNTIARANIFNTRSGTDLLNIVTGRVPVIEPDYRITVPANPILAATDFALRLAGSILPVSPIVGSYWDTSINSGQPTTIQQLNNAFKKSGVGKFFSRVLGFNKTGSQLFLNNTGGGQKSRLFDNLDYNRYKPDYPRTIFDRLGGEIVGTSSIVSNYYVGSITSDPSRIFSPGGDLPVDSFAREIGTPVYGPTELAQLYEGPSRSVRLGANGPTYGSGGGVEGGFTWVSPKYKGNAGKKVGPGGEIIQQDEDFRPSSYNSTESTNYEFRDGSILDDTQRIIDSQPSGGRRLQHVGNAIDQVSKVFHDGYKEITKGSKVIKYTGSIGQEVGYEYCRLFTKDVPYLQYNDLQKVDGITTSGRKISYSVLDNTYNLNIFPNKKDSAGNSTNLVGDTDGTYHVKKYMFSLENLAWRTSSTPGYTVSDLPVCERGPNGGRVMWFPPYDLKFSETNSASWKDSSFIGRPEPVYTYSNTRRTGTLTWKIVVDHPSVLNLIVNKVLTNETNNSRIDDMINSFFAGCLKYDLYELAEKYPLANPNELYNIQRELDLGQLSKEQLGTVKGTLTSGNDSPLGEEMSVKSNPELKSNNIQTALTGIGFYFENEEPTGASTFSTLYDTYILRKPIIIDQSPTVTSPYSSSPQQVSGFFDNVIKWNYDELNKNLTEIYNGFNSGNIERVTFNLAGTTSSSTNKSYNKKINESRIESIKTYINNYRPGGQQKTLQQIPNSKINYVTVSEESSVRAKSSSGYGSSYNCGDKDSKKTDSTSVNTINAMACRRIAISSINVQQKIPVAQNPANSKQEVVTSQNGTTNVVQNTNANRSLPTKNLSKKVLRLLLSECDYFESIKQDTPMVYDNLKEKLKFFNPGFHSTTPEGLNSRLTFLNQCLRPGETIPVVKSVNGKAQLQYNNAVNTAFGAPPVLVLRVGDFYNTKIIPDNLTISYEGLDLNPEGIGVQPMIANVSLSFKFVGGSGIKDAVDKLQNALSFNYYANTEVYDDRAEATGYDKTTKDLDTLFASIYDPTPAPPTTNEVQNNDGQKNGGTIGEILSTTTTELGSTGEISYTKFYSNLSDKTQEYFRNVVNKNKEVLSQYNEAVRQVFTLTRNYTDGKILGIGSDYGLIFGKPSNYQSNVDTVLNDLISDIQSGDDQFLQFITTKGFSNKAIRALKNNYKNFVIQKKSTFSNALSKIIQDFTILQQNYVIELAKLNIITYGDQDLSTKLSGTDGYQEKNNNVIVYYTSGDSLNNLVSDANIVRNSLDNFSRLTQETVSFTVKNQEIGNKLVRSNKDKFEKNAIFLWTSDDPKFDDVNFQREYFVLSNEIVDVNKYEAFKSFLINDILNTKSLMENGNTNLSEMFDEYWLNQVRPKFVLENQTASEFINYLENNTLKDFINYTALKGQSNKTLTYSNVPKTSEDSLKNNRTTLISSIGKTTNSNTKNTTFNDDEGSINITKVKLN
jgi:hypothetical protein